MRGIINRAPHVIELIFDSHKKKRATRLRDSGSMEMFIVATLTTLFIISGGCSVELH